MPLTESARQCQAKAKSTGEQCKNPAMKGKDVCRLHGGKAGAPPKHGRYAEGTRERLQEKIKQYRDDPEREAQWDELALLRAVLQDYLEGLTGRPDREAVETIVRLQSAIRRTLNTINKIESRSALTAAEVDYLQAAVADVLQTHVPQEQQQRALDDLRARIESTNGHA